MNPFDPPGSIELIENGGSEEASFRFTSFVWNGVELDLQEIYVTCELRLCDSSIGICDTKVGKSFLKNVFAHDKKDNEGKI